MKLRVPVRDFRAAFEIAGRFVASGKLAPPIATHVKLAVHGDGSAEMAACDPPKGSGCRVPIANADGATEGESLLPRAVIDQILKAADDDTAEIASSGLKLKIVAGAARWTVTTTDPALFPAPPRWEGDADFILPAGMVGLVHDRLGPFTDPNTERYALGGECTEWGDGLAVFAASDGIKAAIQRVPCETSSSSSPMARMVVPAEFFAVLGSIFPVKSGPVEFRMTANFVAVRAGGVVAASNYNAGRFPGVGRDMFGDGGPFAISIEDGEDAKAFRRAFVQAGAIQSGPDERTPIEAAFSGGVMSLVGRAGELGISEVDQAVAYRGDPIVVGYLSNHLMPALAAPGDAPFTFAPDPKQATRIETLDGFEAWIMPYPLGVDRK